MLKTHSKHQEQLMKEGIYVGKRMHSQDEHSPIRNNIPSLLSKAGDNTPISEGLKRDFVTRVYKETGFICEV